MPTIGRDKKHGPYFSFKEYLGKDYLRVLDPNEVRKAMNVKNPKKRQWGVVEQEEESPKNILDLLKDKKIVNRMMQTMGNKVRAGMNKSAAAGYAAWMHSDDFGSTKDADQESLVKELVKLWDTRDKPDEENEEDVNSSEEFEFGNPDVDNNDPSNSQEMDVDPETSDEETETDNEDPNRQGLIRTVEKAHLVYKRQTPDGTYEELWIYNLGGSMKDELSIRRNILAGTDIPPNRTKSEDGSQQYDVWTVGNAQLVHITGLPN